MTNPLEEARKTLKQLGMVIRYIPMTGEYRVNFAYQGTEESAYYTDSLEDAVETGKLMSRHRK